jgi:hypothetical protein
MATGVSDRPMTWCRAASARRRRYWHHRTLRPNRAVQGFEFGTLKLAKLAARSKPSCMKFDEM